jgi:hypothetical protein
VSEICPHTWIRYVLDNSAASRDQADSVDAKNRPYRDVPMWPTAAFAYAESIGSDFASRVVEMACAACGMAIDADMARISDPMPRHGRYGGKD